MSPARSGRVTRYSEKILEQADPTSVRMADDTPLAEDAALPQLARYPSNRIGGHTPTSCAFAGRLRGPSPGISLPLANTVFIHHPGRLKQG